MTLLVRGKPADSVFRLNGIDENSATYALGWTLEQCPRFLEAMAAAWFGKSIGVSNAVISLQKHGSDGGFTDIEIHAGSRFHVVLEAKRHWGVPTKAQLLRYYPRLASVAAKVRRLVTVSAADAAFASRHLPKRLGATKVVHQSWGDVQKLASLARAKSGRVEEKLWLRHLVQHLQEFVAMDRIKDNTVYVVSLGANAMVDGGKHTWIDVVEKDGRYFHPIDKGWPADPPNYVGFRYRGKLQSVHHVDGFDIVRDLSKVNRLWLKTSADNFIYRLGPPMRPPTGVEVRTGKIFRNGRVYCSIDTLLSGEYATIAEARDETRRRLEASQ